LPKKLLLGVAAASPAITALILIHQKPPILCSRTFFYAFKLVSAVMISCQSILLSNGSNSSFYFCSERGYGMRKYLFSK